MKATAIAPANIAFIKYWGKANANLRLPLNSSLSMNLSEAFTTTTVEFSQTLKQDQVQSLDSEFSQAETRRIKEHLDRVRKKAKLTAAARVATKNNFPKGSGIASSASGFAALTVAASNAAGLNLAEKELTILARLGSGSACRSIPDGFVEWKTGESSQDSYAYSVASSNHWDLRDIIAIVSSESKMVSSTQGHERAQTSPFWKDRVMGIGQKLILVKAALKEKNMAHLGIILEEDALNMHAIMMTQNPPLFYWKGITTEIMHAVRFWRRNGLSVYFTIDAGPNVHLICEGSVEEAVLKKVKTFSGVLQIVSNKQAQGTKLVNKHLF